MHLITRLVSTASRHAIAFVVLGIVLAGLGLTYAALHLKIDTDTDNLFAKNLPWRQAQIQESKNFPQFNKLIVAVVRATTPEEAAETASALNAALQKDTTNFTDSLYPAGDDFYHHEGLLLLPQNDLVKLLTSIIAAQPFLGQLAADPSARGLFTGLSLITQGVSAGQNLTPYNDALKAVQQNLTAAAAGHAVPLSWQGLISGAGNIGGTEFVLAHPKLDQGSLEPGGVATKALVAIAATLPDVRAGRATVDYTGQIPLSDEEFASLTQGLLLGSLIALFLIAVWLYLALRSLRMIIAIIATLLLGLALTISFAAIFIGVINLISVAFAILFIGLAVDFAIQFCVRLRDVRHHQPLFDQALVETARQAGGQIALAAAATACGFLAFAPTSFIGVAELGIIAGVGMFIAFFCTILFLPALLRLLNPPNEQLSVSLPYSGQADSFLRHQHRPVLAVFAILALAGVFCAFTISFDANPLDTKDPQTESMRTLGTLLDDPATNPFSASVLVPNLDAARALSAKLQTKPEIAQVISGATYVPLDQTQKLAMLAQAQTILAPTLAAAMGPPPTPPTADDIRKSMQSTHDAIIGVAAKLPASSPLLGIATALASLESAPDAQILAMNAAITRFLPQELSQLNDSLSATEITQKSLPQNIRSAWFLPNGQVRVEAFPAPGTHTTASLHKFARAVLSAAPKAGGSAVEIIATAGTILYSFREAFLLSGFAITIILLIVFRNVRDTALVLATLILSALLTALFAKLAGLAINYANIIALPLLLGVGVSFNVYFVMNARAGMRNFVSSATAHAVLFSALTTGTAFGTLKASADRGTASMGELLLLSLAAVLIATFVFLPAMLYALPKHARKN